jgi:hypothetical protein
MALKKDAMVILLAITLLFCSKAVAYDDLCLLCGDGGVSGMKRPDYNVNSKGLTCAELALEIALGYDEGSNKCERAIQDYGQTCCGEEEPDPIEQAPTASPIYAGKSFIDLRSSLSPSGMAKLACLLFLAGPMGNYPRCPICWDETYPANEAMVINILGLGADSCRMYYAYGERGLIRTHLCDSLQYFAYEPCGCGEIANPTATQHPSSTRAPAPTSTPAPDSDKDGSKAGYLSFIQWLLDLFFG